MLDEEPQRKTTTKTDFKRAVNEPQKLISVICLPSPSVVNVRSSAFLSSGMKRVAWQHPHHHHHTPKQQTLLTPALYVSTYRSFLFCPFCFPAKLLNSSSVGCWYQRRLLTQKERTQTQGGKKEKGWINHNHKVRTSRVTRNSSEPFLKRQKCVLEVFPSAALTHTWKATADVPQQWGYLSFKQELGKKAATLECVLADKDFRHTPQVCV